jgi:hypothetical protein
MSIAWTPQSRPKPEPFTPPNGTSTGVPLKVLIQTYPERISFTHRSARLTLVVQAPAAKPYSVLVTFKARDRDNRPKYFFLENSVLRFHVGEDRRCIEISAVERLCPKAFSAGRDSHPSEAAIST